MGWATTHLWVDSEVVSSARQAVHVKKVVKISIRLRCSMAAGGRVRCSSRMMVAVVVVTASWRWWLHCSNGWLDEWFAVNSWRIALIECGGWLTWQSPGHGGEVNKHGHRWSWSLSQRGVHGKRSHEIRWNVLTNASTLLTSYQQVILKVVGADPLGHSNWQRLQNGVNGLCLYAGQSKHNGRPDEHLHTECLLLSADVGKHWIWVCFQHADARTIIIEADGIGFESRSPCLHGIASARVARDRTDWLTDGCLD